MTGRQSEFAQAKRRMLLAKNSYLGLEKVENCHKVLKSSSDLCDIGSSMVYKYNILYIAPTACKYTVSCLKVKVEKMKSRGELIQLRSQTERRRYLLSLSTLKSQLQVYERFNVIKLSKSPSCTSKCPSADNC